MPFPRKYLNEGEEIILDLRPHWSFFIGPAAALVASIVLAVVAATQLDADWATLPALILAAVCLVWVVARYARWVTTNFTVTSDRLIHRTGVFSKHGKEIPLERLNDISFRRTLVERMVGAGDLLIESAGEQGQQEFHNFSHPEQLQNEIHRQIELAHARDADRMAGRRELTPLEQLEKLDELRQRGVISQAEFEAKKAQLLDRF
ncbi:MAG: PH domain-containing protein [Acidimicrobiales bacterium]|nr:PH domain-containing protein [Actinomycetota bacterium]